MRFVYIVRCKDDSLYTGISTDVEKRILDHNSSKIGAKYTRNRRPVVLVWRKEVSNRNEATKLELSIKKMTKPEKEKLIDVVFV